MPKENIREVLLSVIDKQAPKEPLDSSLATNSVLSEAAERLNIRLLGKEGQQALLAQLHDLFRTGYLAWGNDIANPNPPKFHITTKGRKLLSNLSRDPGNPDGYMAYILQIATLNPIAKDYIKEGIQCYVSDLHRSCAVMIGAASESLILELRDALSKKLIKSKKPVPAKLNDWKIKTISDKLFEILSGEKEKFPASLRQEFESYWPAFIQQVRASRNDSGHPSEMSPLQPETVYASLLIFPEILKLQNSLIGWIKKKY
jgi:hypothetical protein